MKTVIISDTHDNMANLEKLFDFCKKEKINFLIHCGDVATEKTLKKIESNFNKVYLALGNADEKNYILKKKSNVKIFENFGEIEINNLKISFCHFPELAKKLFETQKYHFVFYGHTHKPWLEKKKERFLANPGNLAGLFYNATFAILDSENKNLELKILEKIY